MIAVKWIFRKVGRRPNSGQTVESKFQNFDQIVKHTIIPLIILRKWLMVAGSELIYIYQTRSGCDVKMYPTTGLRPDGRDCGWVVVARQDFCHLICKRPNKLVSPGENTRVYYNRLFSQTSYCCQILLMC